MSVHAAGESCFDSRRSPSMAKRFACFAMVPWGCARGLSRQIPFSSTNVRVAVNTRCLAGEPSSDMIFLAHYQGHCAAHAEVFEANLAVDPGRNDHYVKPLSVESVR